ncbi:hypothetical protein Tco_0296604 [Tanacetum coccineum]
MTKMAEPKTTTLRLHYCRQLQVLRDGEFEFWPTCDPTMKACNEGDRIYGLDEHGALKQWHCHLDNERRCMKGRNISFPDFLLVRNTYDPFLRSLDEYKAVFYYKIEQLANEYELRIGKRGMSWTIYGRNVNMSMEEHCTHGTMMDLRKKSDAKVVLTKNITTHLKYVLKHLR